LSVRGSKSKIEEQCFVEGSWRTAGQKWRDSIEKQKRRIDFKFVRDKQTDGQTHRQSQRQKIIDS